MDELLIEEKKYVSSKRAAKMTGYAKDYIGQLCREGRVPARLVGRNWYVLETAIQDHRFGTIPTPEMVGTPTSDVGAESIISPKWESPRYESTTDEFLPSVNRLKTPETGSTDENSEEVKDSERLQDTWKTWFDRVADTETYIPTVENIEKEKETEIKTELVEKIEEEEPVDVPIHTIYRQPPEELLPRSQSIEIEEQRKEEPVVWSRTSVVAIQTFSVLLALIVASLAVVGSGYLDEYIISNSQVRIISGVGLYNK